MDGPLIRNQVHCDVFCVTMALKAFFLLWNVTSNYNYSPENMMNFCNVNV